MAIVGKGKQGKKDKYISTTLKVKSINSKWTILLLGVKDTLA